MIRMADAALFNAIERTLRQTRDRRTQENSVPYQ